MDLLQLPPEPSDNYVLWRKDIEVWKKLTETPKDKLGLALQYTCRNRKRLHEAVLSIPEEQVEGENGINNVLQILDELHYIDKTDSAVTSYNNFMSLNRKANQSVANYIIEFEAMYSKVKALGNKLSEDVLTYRLLRTLNLTETEEKIVKASTVDFKFLNIKNTLKRMFGESTEHIEVKENKTCIPISTKDQTGEMTFITNRKNLRKSTRNEVYHVKHKSKWFKYGKNPVDKNGKITNCHICNSINHWKSECPDETSLIELKSRKPSSSHIVSFVEEKNDKAVCRNDSKRFNDSVVIDIRNIQGQCIVIIVDTETKYLEAEVLTSSSPQEINDFLLNSWISVFGQPNKLYLLNRGNLMKEEFMMVTEAYNINIIKTEELLLHRLVANFSDLLNSTIDKILNSVNCPFFVAVAWAVCAQNCSGYSCNISPSQLVFGRAVFLPSVKGFKPPVLQQMLYHELIKEHLEEKRKARNFYVYETSCELRKYRYDFEKENSTQKVLDNKFLQDHDFIFKKDISWDQSVSETRAELRNEIFCKSSKAENRLCKATNEISKGKNTFSDSNHYLEVSRKDEILQTSILNQTDCVENSTSTCEKTNIGSQFSSIENKGNYSGTHQKIIDLVEPYVIGVDDIQSKENTFKVFINQLCVVNPKLGRKKKRKRPKAYCHPFKTICNADSLRNSGGLLIY